MIFLLLRREMISVKITVHSEFENDILAYNHFTKSEHRKEEYFWHYHDVTELLFVKSGEVTYEVGGKKYTLQKNMLVYTRPNERHCIDVNSDADYERYNILFDPSELPFDLNSMIPKNVNVVNFDANKTVTGIFDKMDMYCKMLPGKELGLVLFNLVCEVLINVMLSVERENDEAAKVDPVVSKAMAYIEENLLKISGIDEICRELYVSKSHLHHLFAAQTGESPKKYVIRKRLEMAHRELALGASATEICSACGFSDYSSFFRAYKNHFGYSPAQTPKTDSVRIAFSDFLKGYKS